MIAITVYGTFSTFAANALGFSRVIVIWDKSPVRLGWRSQVGERAHHRILVGRARA
jgi:hypothetical protein